MKNTLSKLSFKLIWLQIGFLYLFSHAAERFYYTLNYEFFECFYMYGKESGLLCFEKYSVYRVSDLLTGPIYFMLYGLIIGTLMLGMINGIRRKHILNVFVVLLMYVSLFLIGVFRFTNDLHQLLLKFAGFFTHKLWAMNFMVVQLYFISGLVLLWLSVRNKHT